MLRRKWQWSKCRSGYRQQPIGGSRTSTRGNALFGARGGRGVDSGHNRHRVNEVMAIRAANLDLVAGNREADYPPATTLRASLKAVLNRETDWADGFDNKIFPLPPSAHDDARAKMAAPSAPPRPSPRFFSSIDVYELPHEFVLVGHAGKRRHLLHVSRAQPPPATAADDVLPPVIGVIVHRGRARREAARARRLADRHRRRGRRPRAGSHPPRVRAHRRPASLEGWHSL